MILGSPGNNRIPRFLATLEPTVYPKNVWWNACLATRVTGLLCLVPILEKFLTLPALLERLTPVRLDEQIPSLLSWNKLLM